MAATAVPDARGEKLNFASMQASDAVENLLEDPRPAVRDRAIEHLVQAPVHLSVPALASVRNSSGNYEVRSAAVFALYRIGDPQAREAVRAAS